ncbi:MAG: hypothetical protein HGA61_04900 [Candidatus Moranbacteria bacterium]|nr:hypothetical protein [Candidatus Moranbacteria bacterium]
MCKKLFVSILLSLLFLPAVSFAQTAPTIEPEIILNQLKQQEQFQKLSSEEQKQMETSLRNSIQAPPEKLTFLGTETCKQTDPIQTVNSNLQDLTKTNTSGQVQISELKLTGYPLEQNQLTTIAACVQTQGLIPVKDAELTLTLQDDQGKTIQSANFQGAVVSFPMLAQKEFSFQATSNELILKAELKKDGNILATQTKTFACEDAKLCPANLKTTVHNFFQTQGLKIALTTIAIIVFGLLLWLGVRKGKDKSKRSYKLSMLGFLLMGIAMLFPLNNAKGGDVLQSYYSSYERPFPYGSGTCLVETWYWWTTGGYEAMAFGIIVASCPCVSGQTGTGRYFIGYDNKTGAENWYYIDPSVNYDALWGAGWNTYRSTCTAAPTDNGCAANTCVGQTCNNGINPVAPGTKICDNGCAANTCVDQTCNNGFGLVSGLLPVNFDTYSCTQSESSTCSLEANCGKINVQTSTCGARRTCDGVFVYDRPLAECVAAGVPCPPSGSVQCPGCQLNFQNNGWREVAP